MLDGEAVIVGTAVIGLVAGETVGGSVPVLKMRGQLMYDGTSFGNSVHAVSVIQS
jgi:hypothetical protein